MSITSGPGGTNAVTGVIGAWIDSIPMIVLSGQVESKDLIGKSYTLNFHMILLKICTKITVIKTLMKTIS